MKKIIIFDTTLRDGEQSPGCSMTIDEKLIIGREIEELGADVIEAGFPIASDGDFEAVKVVSRECRTATIAALSRTTAIDIETAARALEEAKYPRIHTFVATSDIHLEFKLKKSREEAAEMAAYIKKYKEGKIKELKLNVTPADQEELDFLTQLFERMNIKWKLLTG